MTRLQDTRVLAIDGGGTRCRIGLSAGREPLVVSAGSANVSTNFDTAVRELRHGIDEVAQRAGLSLEELTHVPAYIGLAGMTGTDMAARLAAALPMRNVRVEDDRPSALRGALRNADGIVAHCGTGSFMAAQFDGRIRLAGGWGPVLGDEASAQWVGRRALSRTLETVDDLIVESELTRKLLSDLGGAPAIVAFAGAATPAELGALAVDVTRHAAQSDANAREILREAAQYIVATSRSLGWAPDLPICLTGGIGPHYKNYLPDEMQSAVSPALGEPLVGAFALAEEFRKEVINECL